ncbi:MAG: acyl-CoA dehydrogenase family protein [Actinomycetota bacterium]|nr:acyl-CoA dehydrogenase family protein [Acidimicrobiia bacterium]MDQ3147602.1 acyl-CoA dehydrogenase family protein [Actinomycetota bacterium]
MSGVDFADTAEDEAFRTELRSWLDEHLAKFLTEWADQDADGELPDGAGAGGIMRSMERRRAWQRTLNQGRWAAINWPVEWGGRAATVTQNVIYSEEMAKARTPGIYNANGLWQIGPMIIRWGTDEQKARWVPNILDAEDHWCQGFSEPEAGSDLANLRTAAVADGDDYVLDGQKIWISSAHIARWGLFLVRTDPGAIERGSKHEGITALIVDMAVPGIECRPIRDITGEEMFNEVFFTGARVPQAYRLGDEGAGWQVAMGTLGHERVGTAGLAITMRADLDSMISLARAVNPDALDDPGLRERIARAHTDIEYTRLLNYRALSKILKGEPNWPEVPLAKLQWSHLAQTLAELAVDLLGPAGMLSRGGPDAVDNGSWNRLYLFQRYTSIGAGTTEVQKNIIADRAIKLPRR